MKEIGWVEPRERLLGSKAIWLMASYVFILHQLIFQWVTE